MSEEKNKLDFDISKMTEEELLKAYDMIKGFLDYLKDNKIEQISIELKENCFFLGGSHRKMN